MEVLATPVFLQILFEVSNHFVFLGVLGNASESESSDEENPPKKQSKNGTSEKNTNIRAKEYIPTRRSGAYALLMALFKHPSQDGYLKKKELQDLAQPYADVSFAQTDIVNAQYYNAWSAMSTLINKELVVKTGNPAKYQLTESGKNLARRLDQAESDLHSSASVITSSAFGSGTKSPAKSAPTIKAVTKGVAKVPTVKKAIHNTNQQTTSTSRSHQESHPTSSGLLQPNDLIFLDDDEFDRYPQDNLMLNLHGRNAPSKSIVKPSIRPEEDVIAVEVSEPEPQPYIDVRDRITLKAGEYDIVLCVDVAEVSGYIT